MELVKINASDYGLEESKAKQIEAQFKPMLEKMTELEKEYNEILKLEVNQETCDKAKELRLRYVKVRTGTSEIHKNQKALYLAGGRFVDGWKNAQLFASQGIEESLIAIEKHYENLEAERIKLLQEKRQLEVNKYEPDMIINNLGTMEDQVYANYITGVKLGYETRIQAEKKAEQDRIEAEKAKIEEDKRIRAENLRLEKEAKEAELKLITEQKERDRLEKIRLEKEEAIKLQKENRNKELKGYVVFIRDYDRLLNLNEKEYQKEFTEIKKGAELQWEYDRKEMQKQATQEQKDLEEKENLKAKLRAKEEAERKEKQRLIDIELAKKKAEKAALLAPDKDKLIELSKMIDQLTLPELKSEEANKILVNVKELLSKTSNYIIEKAANL